jgi:hypothetical protein
LNGYQQHCRLTALAHVHSHGWTYSTAEIGSTTTASLGSAHVYLGEW